MTLKTLGGTLGMTTDQYIALFSATVSFVALIFVGVQIRAATRQRTSDSLVKILDVNRELITLGFSHPELFEILTGDKNPNPVKTQRYLQLWLNQFSLVFSYLQHSVLRGEAKDNLERDLSEFMTMPNMRKHWQKFGRLYPASFQSYINEILKKDEPPGGKPAHHEGPTHPHHEAKT
jgi:hypothetical protein